MSSSADWFARKLQGAQPAVQQGRPETAPPMPSSQQPMAEMPQQFQQSNDPARLAQSASQTQSCPDCGSGNYFAVANAMARCYDCGYPIQQQGSKYGSLSTARVEGGTADALGNNTSNNYNPQGIIGRIQ